MLKETEIKQSVFEKIRGGEVSMRPKIYFTARLFLVILLAIIALALAIFTLSFALFSIHESGEQFLLGFGQHGLVAFIALFPWGPLLLSILLIFLLDYLLRYFKFGYRVSVLEIFLIALAVVVALGIAVNFTPLHSALQSSADQGELPVLGTFYEEVHDSHEQQGVYRGIISSIQDNTFVCTGGDNDRDTDDGTWTVVAPSGFDMTTLRVGERVYVVGKLILGKVQAYGIQEFTQSDR